MMISISVAIASDYLAGDSAAAGESPMEIRNTVSGLSGEGQFWPLNL